MANVPLVANPIFPPVPDEPKLDVDPQDEEGQQIQKTFDSLWKWMKDLSVQLKILFGSPASSNSAITIPLVQAGTVLAFAGIPANVPSGYLLCDGSQVSQTQYPSLFSALGTTWNTGGETAGNFRVPDLRGLALVGAGTGSGLTARSVGQSGGEESHTLTIPEIPSHSHTITDPGHSHATSESPHQHTGTGASNPIFGSGGNFNIGEYNGTIPGRPDLVSSQSTGLTIQSAATGITESAVGGGGSHNNMQPFGVIQWIVKY